MASGGCGGGHKRMERYDQTGVGTSANLPQFVTRPLGRLLFSFRSDLSCLACVMKRSDGKTWGGETNWLRVCLLVCLVYLVYRYVCSSGLCLYANASMPANALATRSSIGVDMSPQY